VSGQLQRLVIGFERDGIQVRTLYRSKAGPGPSTKARRREVAQLARAGLREALAALDSSAGGVILVGTSGFETREDTLSVDGRAA